MSDIPAARAILQEIKKDPRVPNDIKRKIGRALAHMLRVTSIRRASSQYKRIDIKIRRRILYLARNYPDMTTTEIARHVGLRNNGRVSEVLHGKR